MTTQEEMDNELHYCTYKPEIKVDEEGYLYEGGRCCTCGKEIQRNYDIKIKPPQNDK